MTSELYTSSISKGLYILTSVYLEIVLNEKWKVKEHFKLCFQQKNFKQSACLKRY
jgi:hypothetical protein